MIGRGKKYSEKSCPRAALSTANPTWPDTGSSPGRRCGKPTSYDKAHGPKPCFL
jgi:hypothetical protein